MKSKKTGSDPGKAPSPRPNRSWTKIKTKEDDKEPSGKSTTAKTVKTTEKKSFSKKLKCQTSRRNKAKRGS